MNPKTQVPEPLSMPRVRPPAKRPQLSSKTLKLLNAYRDSMEELAECRVISASDNVYRRYEATVRKARRKLVKHLLETRKP